MKAYADTNIFTNLWLDLSHSEEAVRLIGELKSNRSVLPVTRLLRMELTNALQRLIYESRRGTQGIRVSSESALITRGDFDSELATEEFLEWRPIPEDALEANFDSLAYRHTATEGFRTYDILHVASALVLGCDTFWSFDHRAKKLAKLEGLQTNP